MNSKEYFFDRCVAEVVSRAGKNEKIQVLELGCGTASYVPILIEKYPQLEYIGIEPIQESFEEALRNLQNVPRVKVLYQLGYENIEGLKEASSDLVISFSVLEHVKQLGRFMDLASRYLKPNGLMVHRYDLGHALYPGSLKEKFHVLLGNNVPNMLTETKFVRYVPMNEVENNYKRVGVEVVKHTYHQMRSHKKLEKELGIKAALVMEDVYKWEFDHSENFSQIELSVREKLFPTVAVWGRKK